MNRATYFALCCLAGLLFAVVANNRDQLQGRISSLFSGNSNAQKASGPPNSSAENLSLSFASGIKIASPSVVSVYTVQISPENGTNEPTTTNSQLQSSRQANQGSGVIIDSTGLIVTSNHLVEAAESIFIAFASGQVVEAAVIGRDLETDLALIKVETDIPLPALELAQTGSMKVGDLVLAIGNPYGVGQTVTLGIVSAVRRRLAGISALQNFVQIDAAINPGNSGGALISPSGKLLGINTAVFSRQNGAQGIGFSIPADVLNWIVPQLLNDGRVIRGWLGIAVDDLINHPQYFGASSNGAVVVGVSENGPAHMAGIRVGDMIVSVDDRDVLRAGNLLTDIAGASPNQTVKIGLQRDRQDFLVEVVLGERPAQVSVQREQLQ